MKARVAPLDRNYMLDQPLLTSFSIYEYTAC
jgi:hypothetical protein